MDAAGSGIIHSEISSEEFKKNGGELEILQLWINLPTAHKSTTPAYTGLQKENIPEIKLDNNKVTLNLIAGKFENSIAPIQSITDIFMSTIEFKKDGRFNYTTKAEESIFLYIIKGN